VTAPDVAGGFEALQGRGVRAAVATPHPGFASLISALSRKGRGDCGRELSEVGVVMLFALISTARSVAPERQGV